MTYRIWVFIEIPEHLCVAAKFFPRVINSLHISDRRFEILLMQKNYLSQEKKTLLLLGWEKIVCVSGIYSWKNEYRTETFFLSKKNFQANLS